MATNGSTVVTILFDYRERKFLGRGGKFQSAEEFLHNPPQSAIDLVPETSRKGTTKKKKTDPGGYFECRRDILCLIIVDDTTGEEREYEICPCPW